MTDRLARLFWTALKEAVAAARVRKATGSLEVRKYKQFLTSEFKFVDGRVWCKGSRCEIDREQWAWSEQAQAIREIQESESYRDLISELEPTLGRERAANMLSMAIGRLVAEHDTLTDDDQVAAAVSVLVDHVMANPTPYHVSVALHGIWTQSLRCEISRDLSLRQPTKEDVEEPTPAFPGEDARHLEGMGSCILDLRLMARGATDILREINRLVTILQLFGLGSVQYFRMRTEPLSLASGPGVLGWDFGQPTIFVYQLKKTAEADLRDFVERMRSLVPETDVLGGDPDPRTSVEIGYARYRDGLFSRGSNESRITSAITALEALFLKREERSELSRRLAQRASLLLKMFGKVPLQINSQIVRAYHVRSEYIHGAMVEATDAKGLVDLRNQLMDWTRVALVAHLQMREKLEKDELLGKLDNALLDENASEKLHGIISESIAIPPSVR